MTRTSGGTRQKPGPSLLFRVYERWVRIRSGSEAILFLPSPRGGIRIPYGSDALQFGELWLPDGMGPHKLIVVIHGGFWRARYDLTHISRVCAALSLEGMACWSLEYRRVGNPGGGFPGTFLDIAAGVDYVRELAAEYNLDVSRITVMGHSAGAHLALWSAARAKIPTTNPMYVSSPVPVTSAISLAGVLDLVRASELRLSSGAADDLIGGSPEQYPERYAAASPIEMLPLGIAQYLVHGTKDQSVPFSFSQEFFNQARVSGDTVSLIPLERQGHFELIDPRSLAWPSILRIAKRAVGLPA